MDFILPEPEHAAVSVPQHVRWLSVARRPLECPVLWKFSGCGDSVIIQVALKSPDTFPGRAFVFAAGRFVVGDEVDFEFQAMQESNQPFGVGNVVSEILDQNIFKSDPFS